ncbi:hypothetical protein FA15DRAFT_654811 [Coprinopsis marcescibilis]|uniref:Uncharacterized protein n=1 Tax=Coprinopsis marcescibilis TaxID=230819 RepID=A0A5C3KZ04_COPMA|nr:hypothetical protein FA15DRAFT_654811 [Coprinopsis marcescibilis]
MVRWQPYCALQQASSFFFIFKIFLIIEIIPRPVFKNSDGSSFIRLGINGEDRFRMWADNGDDTQLLNVVTKFIIAFPVLVKTAKMQGIPAPGVTVVYINLEAPLEVNGEEHRKSLEDISKWQASACLSNLAVLR